LGKSWSTSIAESIDGMTAGLALNLLKELVDSGYAEVTTHYADGSIGATPTPKGRRYALDYDLL
jgi:hypothetical protein